MQVKLYRGKYYAAWTENGKTKRTSLRTTDYPTALQRLEDYKNSPEVDTIGGIYPLYLEDKKDLSSYPSMVEAWKSLFVFFAHLRPDQVTRILCRSYVEHRKRQGRSNGTIIKELGCVRAAINWYKPNNGAIFEMPSQPAPRERYLTKREFATLLENCASPHIRLFVILALTTAGRKSAILQLRWEQVDFYRDIIHLAIPDELGRRKGRASVPMSKKAKEALIEAKNGALTEWVIEYNAKPVKDIKKAFQRACERAKLKDVTPHILRHTAAVWMVERGTPIIEISKFLGHSNSQITEKVYAKYSPNYLRGAAAALDDW